MWVVYGIRFSLRIVEVESLGLVLDVYCVKFLNNLFVRYVC